MLLTQSTVESLMLSPCRVTEKPRGVKVPPSEAMFTGTVEHAIVEDFTAGRISKLQACSPQTVISYGERLAREEGFALADLIPRKDQDRWAAKVANLTMAYIQGPWAETIRHWEILEQEEPRAVEIAILSNGQSLWLATGGIDLIGRSPELGVVGVDVKTSGRGWGGSDGPGRIQHNTYALLAYEDYGLIDDWRYLVGDLSKLAWRWHPAAVTPASLQSTRDRIVEWAEYLILPNRPTLCTPYDGKKRGWWAKPAYNDGWCRRCRHLGDQWDDDPAWADTFGERWRRDPKMRESVEEQDDGQESY